MIKCLIGLAVMLVSTTVQAFPDPTPTNEWKADDIAGFEFRDVRMSGKGKHTLYVLSNVPVKCALIRPSQRIDGMSTGKTCVVDDFNPARYTFVITSDAFMAGETGKEALISYSAIVM